MVLQLANFTRLVLCLLKNGCIEGALQVADRLSLLLGELDLTEPRYTLDESQIYDYLNMTIALEADQRTADPLRIPRILKFFSRLEIPQQIRLVVDLQKNFDRLKDVPFHLELYRRFCGELAAVDLPSESRRVRRLIVRLIRCYSQLEDEKLLVSLIDKIFLKKPSVEAEMTDSPRNPLRETILSSQWIWNQPAIVARITSSTVAKSAFYDMFDVRVSYFSDHDTDPDYATSGRKMLSDCLRFAMCMETHQLLADPWRLSSFSAVITRLSVDELGQLIISLTKSVCLGIKKTSSSSIASFICRQFLSRGAESLVTLSKEDFLQVFKRLVWLEKEKEVQSVILIVCTSVKDNEDIRKSWNSVEEDSLVEMMLTSPDVFGDLDSFVDSFLSEGIRQLILQLIDAWLNGLYWALNPLDSLSHVSPDEAFVNKITKCFEIFIKTEKRWPSDQVPKSVEILEFVFARTPFHLLFNIVDDVYNLELDESPSLKEFPTCLKLFRDLCRRCLGYDEFDCSSDMSQHYEKLLEIFFWIDDGASLMAMCHKLCRSPSSDALVKEIVDSSEFQHSASTSCHGRAAFCLLLDHRIKALKAQLYPVFSWSQLEASFPENPEIQEFLRSPLQFMEYGDFEGPGKVDETRDELVALLDEQESFDIKWKLIQQDVDYWQLTISKRVQHIQFPLAECQESLTAELNQVVGLRQKFEKNGVSTFDFEKV